MIVLLIILGVVTLLVLVSNGRSRTSRGRTADGGDAWIMMADSGSSGCDSGADSGGCDGGGGDGGGGD